ncbi:ion channel protein [Streptomyces sp. NPDC054837]
MAQDTAQQATATPARALLPLILPALVVGVGASLLLLGVSAAAEGLQHVLWGNLPDALGIGRYSVLWTIVMLTATGVAVGLVIWKAPGHAGPDPATTGLDAPVLPPAVLPGLLLATALMLAGGPSLGPENPIIAVNVGLAFWLGRRLLPRLPGGLWVALAEAATIGALFGTPVAAALLISEALAGRQLQGALWDNVFAPLVAAAGAVTTTLVAHPTFDLDLPPFGHPGWGDLLAVLVIASAAALLGMCAAYAFPYVHGAFARPRHPMVALPVAGQLLAITRQGWVSVSDRLGKPERSSGADRSSSCPGTDRQEPSARVTRPSGHWSARSRDPTKEGARRRLGAGRVRDTLPQLEYIPLIRLPRPGCW